MYCIMVCCLVVLIVQHVPRASKYIILLTKDASINSNAATEATSAKNDGTYIIVVGERMLDLDVFKKTLLKLAHLCRSYPFPGSITMIEYIHVSLFRAMDGAIVL